MVGADRADDDCQRALFAGHGRSLAPRDAKLAVADAVRGRDHVVVDKHDLAPDRTVGRGAQCIDTVERDDLAGDAFGAGRAAVPSAAPTIVFAGTAR